MQSQPPSILNDQDPLLLAASASLSSNLTSKQSSPVSPPIDLEGHGSSLSQASGAIDACAPMIGVADISGCFSIGEFQPNLDVQVLDLKLEVIVAEQRNSPRSAPTSEAVKA